MNIIASMKKGFALAVWQKDNSFCLSYVRYKGIPVFTLTDSSSWDDHGFYAMAAIHEGNSGIYITKLVDESPHRDFVLAHEHGHIQLGHLTTGKVDNFFMHMLKRSMGNQLIINRELEADAYAATVVGYAKAIAGINYLIEIMGPSKELTKRLDALMAASL